MKPEYVADVFSHITIESVVMTTPWIKVTDARLECFMSSSLETYTYGSGKGVRTYVPVPYIPIVQDIQLNLNDTLRASFGKFNVCFLNRYDTAQHALGWHADDSPGMDHGHPITVVSFGQSREIWWREIGYKGIIPSTQKQLLKHGSVFVMPPGFQLTHEHKIPKGDRDMTTRVSLTFRHYCKS